jgi:hypothetical protein
MRNFYPRAGMAWGAVIGAGWYGFWLLVAISTGRLAANPSNLGLMKVVLPGGLLLMFLYWQVVPLLMAATGASLELRKLQVYPIPASQLFSIEVMLRVTAAVEMLLVTLGLAFGILLNPTMPKWTMLVLAPFVLFNLFLAVGLRDLVARILAHKRIREPAAIVDAARPGRRKGPAQVVRRRLDRLAVGSDGESGTGPYHAAVSCRYAAMGAGGRHLRLLAVQNVARLRRAGSFGGRVAILAAGWHR